MEMKRNNGGVCNITKTTTLIIIIDGDDDHQKAKTSTNKTKQKNRRHSHSNNKLNERRKKISSKKIESIRPSIVNGFELKRPKKLIRGSPSCDWKCKQFWDYIFKKNPRYNEYCQNREKQKKKKKNE